MLAFGLSMLYIPNACSSDMNWLDGRYDLHNTGYVDGTGGLYAMVESYRLLEDRNITTIPVSIDLDGDGSTEVAYPTEGGYLVLRRGVDGGLIDRIAFNGNITGPPLVYDHRSDGTVDLLVLVTNDNGTTIHLVRGTDLSTTVELVLPDQSARGEGSVGDIDGDGQVELVFSVDEGYIHTVDLSDFSIMWTRQLSIDFAGLFAIYNGSNGPRIAVTSGFWFAQWGDWGCSTLFVLNGLNGDIEYSFEGYGSICTPPTVVRVEPSTWIAFGTFPGNIYVLDVDTNTTILEKDRFAFDGPPYWRHIDLIKDPGGGVDRLILFGDRAMVMLRISDGTIVWGEYHKYPISMTDSLICDIDDDGTVESVVLNVSRIENQSSVLRFIDPWDGRNETFVAGLPKHPVGMIIADIDDDGSLEVLLCFKEWIIFMNEEPYVVVHGILPTNGSVYMKGDPIEFRVLYTYRDAPRVPIFEWTSDVQGTIGMEAEFISDALNVGHHIINLTIDDHHGHLIVFTLELDVEKESGPFTDGIGPWLFLLIIIIVVALVSMLYWRRGHR